MELHQSVLRIRIASPLTYHKLLLMACLYLIYKMYREPRARNFGRALEVVHCLWWAESQRVATFNYNTWLSSKVQRRMVEKIHMYFLKLCHHSFRQSPWAMLKSTHRPPSLIRCMNLGRSTRPQMPCWDWLHILCSCCHKAYDSLTQQIFNK